MSEGETDLFLAAQLQIAASEVPDRLLVYE